MNNPPLWTIEEKQFLITNYPNKGKMWCAEEMHRSEASIRKAAWKLKLKLNPKGEFFKDFQKRAATSKIGKKRPAQAEVIRKCHADGKMEWDAERRLAMSIMRKDWYSNHDHPRGMLGKKHSEEFKLKQSEKTRKFMASLTDDQLASIILKGMKTKEKNGTMHTFTRAKASWKAGKRLIGGVNKYYRSAWEANYARYLQWLQELGEIKKWEHEAQTFWFDDIKRGCVCYLPDFRVTENNGQIVFHEVKGWMDDRSKTKIKRMAKYHPEVKLIVIDAKIYASIKKTMSCIIKEWE